MNAHEITKALGGHWHGSYGMSLCPSHTDGREPALKVSNDDRKDDGIDLHCFGGCDWRDVKEVLRRRGLLPERERKPTQRGRQKRQKATRWPEPRSEDSDDAARRITAARGIWRASQSAQGTLVQKYLRSRGILLEAPPSIRFHPGLDHKPTGLVFPVMLAGVQAPDRQITAVHRTYLLPDGSAKAGVINPKLAKGVIGSGAVRLAKAGPILGICEGVETALSCMEIFGLPVWCALGSRLDRIVLPAEVRKVVVLADAGNAGMAAARKAVATFVRQGRGATICVPEIGDFNDVARRAT